MLKHHKPDGPHHMAVNERPALRQDMTFNHVLHISVVGKAHQVFCATANHRFYLCLKAFIIAPPKPCVYEQQTDTLMGQ